MRREFRERFLHHRLQRKPPVSDPGMHHGTCVTHVPWCMSISLTSGVGENVPGIPGACATRNFTYLARGPLVKTFLKQEFPYYNCNASILVLSIFPVGYLKSIWNIIQNVVLIVWRNHKQNILECALCCFNLMDPCFITLKSISESKLYWDTKVSIDNLLMALNNLVADTNMCNVGHWQKLKDVKGLLTKWCLNNLVTGTIVCVAGGFNRAERNIRKM